MKNLSNKIERIKIGRGYYQNGYGKGFKKAPIVYLINGKAYAKDKNHPGFQTDLDGYAMVNQHSYFEEARFWQVGLISEHLNFIQK